MRRYRQIGGDQAEILTGEDPAEDAGRDAVEAKRTIVADVVGQLMGEGTDELIVPAEDARARQRRRQFDLHQRSRHHGRKAIVIIHIVG